MTLKILMSCAISSFTGYGRDGIGLAQALIRSGADVYVRPPHVAPPLPDEICDLFKKELAAPFDIFIDHQDPGLFGNDPHNTQAAKISVAATMWEMTSVQNNPNHHTISKRLSKFQVFLPYDQNTKQCFEPYLPEAGETHVQVLQGGYDQYQWGYHERDWDSDRFAFCMVGQLSNRKNPYAVLDAWGRLHRDHPDEMANVELHLKTTNGHLHPSLECVYKNLKVYATSWPTDTIRELYHHCHCLLAPSRGEGKNLPALEAMTTGIPTIATNWGGHTEWLTPDIGYPLNYTMVPVNQQHPDCNWAAVDPQHLADTMLHVVRNKDEVRRKGLLASRIIPPTKSWDNYVARMYSAVRDSGCRYSEEVTEKVSQLVPTRI